MLTVHDTPENESPIWLFGPRMLFACVLSGAMWFVIVLGITWLFGGV